MICNCSLAGTRACLSCSQYLNVFGQPGNVPIRFENGKIEKLFKIKRTIEKFDDKGNLIERVIEEE